MACNILPVDKAKKQWEMPFPSSVPSYP